jgi:hypothetical protein
MGRVGSVGCAYRERASKWAAYSRAQGLRVGTGYIRACETSMEAREPERRLWLPFLKEASSLPCEA